MKSYPNTTARGQHTIRNHFCVCSSQKVPVVDVYFCNLCFFNSLASRVIGVAQRNLPSTKEADSSLAEVCILQIIKQQLPDSYNIVFHVCSSKCTITCLLEWGFEMEAEHPHIKQSHVSACTLKPCFKYCNFYLIF